MRKSSTQGITQGIRGRRVGQNACNCSQGEGVVWLLEKLPKKWIFHNKSQFSSASQCLLLSTKEYTHRVSQTYSTFINLLQVYKVKLYRVQMKNSARVSCAHLLKSPSTAEQSLFCKLVAYLTAL